MTKTEIISAIELMNSQLIKLKDIVLIDGIEEEEKIDYEVSWVGAPDWALAHAYDESGEGFWYGPHLGFNNSRFSAVDYSNWKIGESVMEIHKKTWKNSITEKPL